MTINPKKTRMENIKKKRKENGWQTWSFQQVFFVQIGVESTAGAKQQKMRMVPRVPNGKKTECILILPFCGAGPTQLASRPVPGHCLVLVRGGARFRVVRLGGAKVRKAHCNVADVFEAGDVFMYRDSSIAPLLDLRRRITAVMDVLDSMIRSGVSMARSLELTVQWDCILGTGRDW